MLPRTFFFLLMIFPYTLYGKSPSQYVRVLLKRDVQEVEIMGVDLLQREWNQERPHYQDGLGKINYACQSHPQRNKKVLARFYSKTGVLRYQEQNYVGLLRLVQNDRRCDLINVLAFERYIAQVIAREMHPDWPLEALKAQAVAARSYAFDAMQKKKKHYDLENSQRNQVVAVLLETTSRVWQAVEETRGEYLIGKEGGVVPGFFHSACGGQTHLPQDIWLTSVEGYTGVSCPFCRKKGRAWSRSFSKEKLSRLLAVRGDAYFTDYQKSYGRYTSWGRDHYFKKSKLRQKLGGKQIPSTTFKTRDQGNYVVLEGRGLGHGVGLCQHGAHYFAQKGWSYKKILDWYYPNFKVGRKS